MVPMATSGVVIYSFCSHHSMLTNNAQAAEIQSHGISSSLILLINNLCGCDFHSLWLTCIQGISQYGQVFQSSCAGFPQFPHVREGAVI
jgi:hypothetical protein